ncbi:hypothetical protein AVEN_55773-1 [Araneus ventricosus]|uniref:MADF domain-containing protein n=1 Tax=Araneus ventricosus TaxID=182803 RepID=A0A4Y2F033_ARAVE|nr:hypothetical protein AVEN_55773-1 [Araneus ventricosus]
MNAEFWGTETVMEFLNLYQREPVIWNPRHPHHKDREQVYDAWKRIQSRLSVQCSIKGLKKRRENLMATFRKCVVKVTRSAGAYKPEWFAYEKMASFLLAIYVPRETKAKQVRSTYGHFSLNFFDFTNTRDGSYICGESRIRVGSGG